MHLKHTKNNQKNLSQLKQT